MTSADVSMPSPVRFGLVCSREGLSQAQAECVQGLTAVEGVSLDLVLVSQDPPALRKGSGRWLERLLFGRRSVVTSLSQALPEQIPIHRLTNGSAAESDHAITVDLVRKHQIDFLLDFVGLANSGELAVASRYGVWRPFVGAGRWIRGAPGMVEILDGEPTTRVALEAVVDALRSTVVVHEAHLGTIDDSYTSNRDQALRASVVLAVRSARQISCGLDPLSMVDDSAVASQEASLTLPLVLTLIWRLLSNRLRRRIRSLYRHETWNVGWVAKPIAAFLTSGQPGPVNWLPTPSAGTFVADPFPVDGPDPLVLLAEVFNYKTGKGLIRTVTAARGGQTEVSRSGIEFAGHASYPYTFSRDGVLYCAPESHQDRVVRLYRGEGTPLQWSEIGNLVVDVAAVDPTVFYHANYWWLLFTDADIDANASLHAWFSESLDGPWRPHAGNPIKTDVRSSRPAGTPFVHEGRLYRPAQDISNTYGGAVALNVVHRLTTEAFEEEVVAVVRPDPTGPYPDGLHTLSACGEITLIDGKRYQLVPAALLAKIRGRRRSLVSRD